jgi:hypothetical protein
MTEGFKVEHENLYTGGWNTTFKNVLFCEGEFDPWRSAGEFSLPSR